VSDHVELREWLAARRTEVERNHRPNAGITRTSCYCDVPEPCEDRIQQLAAIEELCAILTRSAELVAENMRIHRELEAALDGNQRLQAMNEGLRQIAIEAREAANSWQQATIDLYSGREEPHPTDCSCGRPEASGTPEQPAPGTKGPTRRNALLAAIQREGGDWSPLRARAALMSAGRDVASNLAAQEMKTLAAHGFLEPIRPRAQTYRLVARDERGGSGG